MSNAKSRAHLTFVVALLCVGWDTQTLEEGGNGWATPHLAHSDGVYAGLVSGDEVNEALLRGNEHAEIGHIALLRLGWRDQLYLDELPLVLALNESIYHPEARRVAVPGSIENPDRIDTPLTERRILNPARLAGLPDVSYSMSDWLNKNALCPSLPMGAPRYEACHTFLGWLGAFNSSHFGNQAEHFYKHIHTIALQLAANASVLRRAIQDAEESASAGGGDGVDRDEAMRFVREAELEALSFEAFAQHFLQDRWSSGHMWNRWNGPSWIANGQPSSEPAFLFQAGVGLTSGIIHGAEAVLTNTIAPDPLWGRIPGATNARNFPDPMCSPVITRDGLFTGLYRANMVEYVDPLADLPTSCVGDYRHRDMVRGLFGGDYGYAPEMPMNVAGQRADMMRCSTAGWADVARAFHHNDDGTLGALQLTVDDAPTFSPGLVSSNPLANFQVAGTGTDMRPCWDHWATNRAIATGASTLGHGTFINGVVDRLEFGAVFFRIGEDVVTGGEDEVAEEALRLTNIGSLARLLTRIELMGRLPVTQNWTTLAENRPLTDEERRALEAVEAGAAAAAEELGLPDISLDDLFNMPDVELGPFRAGPGNEYIVPDDLLSYAGYIEPIAQAGEASHEPFASLPDQVGGFMERSESDRPGRDLHTLYGFYNRAHTTYWCTNAQGKLLHDEAHALDAPQQGLRWPVPLPQGGGSGPSPEESRELARRLDACVHIAERLYAETRAFYPVARPLGEYEGESQESRRLEHGDESRPQVRPPCDVFGALPDGHTNVPSGTPGYWEDNPYELHPGYVTARDVEDPESGPYRTVELYEDHVYYRSILSWCRALPVVNVNSDDIAVDDEAGEAIVVTPGYDSSDRISFAPSDRDPEVTIYGYNFGEEEGQIKLLSENGCIDPIAISPLVEIVRWTGNQIRFRVDHTRFPPDLYRIEVIRADRMVGEDMRPTKVRSVGRALLDIRRSVFGDVTGAGAPLAPDETDRQFRVIHPYCAGGVILSHSIHDCSDIPSRGAPVRCGAPVDGVGAELWPASPGGPGPYPDHTWATDQVGECRHLVFPGGAGCPDYAPTTYGLTYLFTRTSPRAVSAVEARWRFTLAWERAGAAD